MRNVGAHWPTKLDCSFLFARLSTSDTPMEPKAAHRNVSDGSLAVCCSIVRATGPSRWSTWGRVLGIVAVISILYAFRFVRLRRNGGSMLRLPLSAKRVRLPARCGRPVVGDESQDADYDEVSYERDEDTA